jgi:hypothetical protein
MARRPAATSPARPIDLSPEEMRRGIDRLSKRLEDVKAFEPTSVTEQHNIPHVEALAAAVDDTLVRTFGADTLDYKRYSDAAYFDNGPFNYAHAVPIGQVQASLSRSKATSIALLTQAIASLTEQLAERSDALPAPPEITPTLPVTDAEIRRKLLATFYERRHNANGWVPTSDINMSPYPVSPQVIGGVCQQLADIGLIQWKPLQGAEGFVVGMAKITGKGVAAIEAERSADIDIRMSSKNTPSAGSPTVPDDLPMSDAALTEIREVVSTIKVELATLTLSNSAKADITADINQIEIETERPTPRRRFMKLYLESLRDNVAKALGAATAGGMVALIAGLIAKYFHVF